MRIALILSIILFVSSPGWSQEKGSSEKDQNEIRLNLFNSLLGSVEAQYEYFFNDNSSVGVNLGIGYGGRNSAFNTIFNVTPNYRAYFSPKKTQGFFIEASTRLSYDEMWKYNFDSSNGSYYEKVGNELNIGLGAAVGWKLVTQKGLVGSLKAGIGRFLNDHSDDYYNSTVYPNLELSIGKRF